MSMATKTVVIPIYKNEISPEEVKSLNQCLKILGRHQITLIAPIGLVFTRILDIFKEHSVWPDIVFFSEFYFADILGYNRLMISREFYERFIRYDYILIYQLDCFVFKDELDYWCRLKYDYIGAPWILNGVENNFIRRIKSMLKKKLKLLLNYPNTWDVNDLGVGNGGFSLRNPTRFLKVIRKMDKTKRYMGYWTPIDYHYNEDMFWSFEVNRYFPNIKKPGWKTALRFAFEINPKFCFEINNHELPFGCHAYSRYGGEFWDCFTDL